MADERDFSVIKQDDFENALEVYLQALLAKWKSERGVGKAAYQQLVPWEPDLDDSIERIRNEILQSVNLYGLNQNAVNQLPEDTASIFNAVINSRGASEWQKQQTEATIDWQKDVQKAVQEDWQNKFNLAKWGESARLAREKFDWQQQQAAKEDARLGSQLSPQQVSEFEKFRQADLQRMDIEFRTAEQRAQAITAGLGGDPEEAAWNRRQEQTKLRSDIFEQMRQDALVNVKNQPREWIKRWQIEQGVGQYANPYQQDRRTATDYLDMQYNTVSRISKAARLAKETLKDESASRQEIDAANAVLTSLQSARNTLYEMEISREVGAGVLNDEYSREVASRHPSQAEAGKWAQPREAPGGGGMVIGAPEMTVAPTPTTPLMPEWLQQASGITAERVPETRGDILTPSGQSWQRLLPSQQAQWAGLVEFAGKRKPEDILSLTSRMLPRNIGGGSRTRAARQF